MLARSQYVVPASRVNELPEQVPFTGIRPSSALEQQ